MWLYSGELPCGELPSGLLPPTPDMWRSRAALLALCQLRFTACTRRCWPRRMRWS